MNKILTIFALIGVLVSTVTCYEGDDEGTAYDNIINAKDDDGKNIEEPCKDIDDSEKFNDCVRDYFSENASCDVPKKVEDNSAHYPDKHIFSVPNINATFVMIDSYLSNLNGKIKTFYINKNTGNLVFSVELSKFYVDVQNFNCFLHRKGEEPKLIASQISTSLNMILTGVIPAKNKINAESLKKSIVYTYISSYNESDISVGPEIIYSGDPEVYATMGALFDNLDVSMEEFLFGAGSSIFVIYLQKYICDFGAPLPF